MFVRNMFDNTCAFYFHIKMFFSSFLWCTFLHFLPSFFFFLQALAIFVNFIWQHTMYKRTRFLLLFCILVHLPFFVCVVPTYLCTTTISLMYSNSFHLKLQINHIKNQHTTISTFFFRKFLSPHKLAT